VFHDTLIVFVNKNTNYAANGNAVYIMYDRAHNAWLEPVSILLNNQGVITHGMSAVVLEDKLCLVSHESDQHIKIYWTTDLVNWHCFDTGLNNIANGSAQDDQISAITASYADTDKKRKSKLVFAYLNDSKHPQYAECKFSDSITLALTTTGTISSNTGKYESVALAEGTISCPKNCPDDCVADNTSTGDCIQAFLKKDVSENGTGTLRIKRFQLKNSVWAEIESNLTTQSSPKQMWAAPGKPLTTCVFTDVDTAYTDTIRRYICLLYYGGPTLRLSMAWAETNKLVYLSYKNHSVTLDEKSFIQYIGYIEGAPPFHCNTDSATAGTGFNASKVTFTVESNNTSTWTYSHTYSSSLSFHAGQAWGFSADILHILNNIHKVEKSVTLTNTNYLVAGSNRVGLYLISQPNIVRGFYSVWDLKNTTLDTIYYFFMTSPTQNILNYTLKDSLYPGNPMTYFNRTNENLFGYTKEDGTDGRFYSSIDVFSNGGQNPACKVSSQNLISDSKTIQINVGLLSPLLSLGKKCTVSYTYTNNTAVSSTVLVNTTLKPATRPTDVTRLEYYTYWIFPHVGMTNWWLHPGATDQNTWCITYDVQKIKYKKGDSVCVPLGDHITYRDPVQTGAGTSSSGGGSILPGSSGREQPSGTVFSLGQNYPNPCRSATRINFRIGKTKTSNGTDKPAVPTKLVVYDLMGKPVVTLVDEPKAPGSYGVELITRQLPVGVYYYKLTSGDYSAGKKMVV
ncbi:MAG: T9SS type A sorting domain-containing protein, partial [Mariniphaga sp.]